MAFGLVPLEKRFKDNIKNYALDQLLDVGDLFSMVENLSHVTGISILLTDRHGEKIASSGNFLGFKPDTANAPGIKIRVAGRTMGHVYLKDDENPTLAARRLVDSFVKELTQHGEKAYECMEMSLYIDDLEQKLEKEQYQVKHGEKEDALTGTLNSTNFDSKLKDMDKQQIVPVALICANINDWKYVNDHFGDEESDRLIQVVASLLKKEAKEDYIIGRCGGDFFNILIPYAEEDEARDYCDRVQVDCLAFEDPHLAPSVAFGYVVKENVEQSLADLLSDAEYEMFNNKFEIKNAPGYRERLEKA